MPENQPKYDVFKQRCVSHRDLYNMLSEDGPTRSNLLCLIDCLQYGFHKKDTRRQPTRVAPGAGVATHDNVVTEVMNRIGPAIEDSIARAIGAAMIAAPIPDVIMHETMPQPETAPLGGGNGEEAVMEPEPERAETPTVPQGYGEANYRGKSEVYGAAEDVTPETLEGLPLAENTTDLKAEPQPVPLTVDELARIRAKLDD